MRNPKHDGILVLDKPRGITSRTALNRVKSWFPRGTRLGHAGTLDPLATGVLVVCVGVATRLVEYVQDMDKEYVTDFTLGAVSDTDDADGMVTPLAISVPPSLETIREELSKFLGWIEQVPPAFSATKVAGQRAYKLAREGEIVTLSARRVRIDAVEVLGYEFPNLRLKISCGKGTYIRAIARDLGQRLGCGAYVRTLRRDRIGTFSSQNAVLLDRPIHIPLEILPLEQAVSTLLAIQVNNEELARLRQGQAVHLATSELLGEPGDSTVAIFLGDFLAAIGRYEAETKKLFPEKVIRQRNEG